MNAFFKSFFALIGLFLLGMIFLGFFLPKEDKIMVSKDLKCSPSHIYAQINDLKGWKTWSPWMEYDPEMVLKYGDTTIGSGASYSWTGNAKVGFGTLKIANSTPDSKIETILNYQDYPASKGGFDIIPNSNGCQVTWYMEPGYPENPILKKFFGGYSYLLGKFFMTQDFEKGLNNLNNTCQ